MKRIPCDLRLVLPRTAALVLAAGWIWFYADTVTAMRQTELLERELQDVLIPAGKSSWVLVDGRSSETSSNDECRGLITAELRRSKRQRAPEEISTDMDSAKDSSLPATQQSAFEKILLFNVTGSVVIDLLGRTFPAEFNGSLTFNEAYTLTKAEGFLKASSARADILSDSASPLTVSARLTVNDTVSTSAFTIEEPIFLIPDRNGNGTLKLPRSLQSGLRSLAPNHSGPAAAMPLHLKPATPQESALCSERLKLRISRLEQEQPGGDLPAIDLKKLPFGATKNTPAAN